MKTLIYELFSGVGFCNQLFSLETAIYLANITNRKLILLVKNPLCHCGKARWDYGYFLDFFDNSYKQFLPHGMEVYYKNIPQNIFEIIKSKDCKTIPFVGRLSSIVITDKHLDTPENKETIQKFCHFRTKCVLDFNSFDQTYLYTDKSNASRCFYNFFTTYKNYVLMSKICKALTNLEESFTNTNINLDFKYISVHLRLGDVKHDKKSIDKNSMKYCDYLVKQINMANEKLSSQKENTYPNPPKEYKIQKLQNASYASYAYYINMDKDTSRRNHCQQLLQDIGFETIHRIKPIDKYNNKLLDSENECPCSKNKSAYNNKSELSINRPGHKYHKKPCGFKSSTHTHKQIWEDIIKKNNDKYYFVFEDDIELTNKIKRTNFLDVLSKEMIKNKTGLLYLGACIEHGLLNTNYDNISCWGANAYLINRKAAQYILDNITDQIFYI